MAISGSLYFPIRIASHNSKPVDSWHSPLLVFVPSFHCKAVKACYFVPFFCVISVFIAGCTPGETHSTAELEAEAEAFFLSYAEDLRNGDRTALRSRYHSDQFYIMGIWGSSRAFPPDSVHTLYGPNWKSPEPFEWYDMSYKALSNDAVSVVGKYNWNGRESIYSGLLLRDDDGLKIHIEHESANPRLLLCQALENNEGLITAFEENELDAKDVHRVVCPSS